MNIMEMPSETGNDKGKSFHEKRERVMRAKERGVNLSRIATIASMALGSLLVAAGVKSGEASDNAEKAMNTVSKNTEQVSNAVSEKKDESKYVTMDNITYENRE